MNHKDKLNQLFEKARMQNPLFDESKVRLLISKEHAVKNSNKLIKNIMKIFILTTIISTGLYHFIGFNKNRISEKPIIEEIETSLQVTTQNNVENEVENIKSIQKAESLSIKPSKILKTNTVNQHQVKQRITELNPKNEGINRAVLSGIHTITKQDTTEFQNVLMNQSVNSIEKTVLDKNKTIVLSKDELVGLGLYMKDSILMFEMPKTKLGFVEANYTLNFGTNLKMSNDKDNSLDSNPVFYFISTPNGNYLFSLYAAEIGKSMEDCEKICPELLPVWVEIENSSIDAFVVWFANDEKTLRLLPQRIRTILNEENKAFSNEVKLWRENKSDNSYEFFKEIADLEIDANQIIEPDDELLLKLGFKISNQLRYFRKSGKNKLKVNNKMRGLHIYRDGCLENKGKKNIKKLFPVYLTHQTVFNSNHITSFKCNSSNIDDLQQFIYDRLTMIAIKVKFDENDYRYFWYNSTEVLLKELKTEDRIRVEDYVNKNKQLMLGMVQLGAAKNTPLKYAQIADMEPYEVSKVKGLTLSTEQLNKLGINVKDKKIHYTVPVVKNNTTSAMILVFGKYGTEIKLDEELNIVNSKQFNFPAFITDDEGKNMRAGFEGKDISNVNLYSLIPVVVKSGDELSTLDKIKNLHHPDLIFWYEPDDQFFNLLDKNIADEIKDDIEAINCTRSQMILASQDSLCDEKNEMSCKYFEACINGIQKGISGYKVYPNPAWGIIKIKLELSQPCNIQVKIFTLNGSLVSQSDFIDQGKGIQEKEINISSLIPGMYLVKIESDKGDVVSERIIVMER